MFNFKRTVYMELFNKKFKKLQENLIFLLT